jgi:hypothetical protein
MLWQGKPLEEYSKKELIEIVEHMCRVIERQSRRHVQELEDLFYKEGK